MRKEENVLIALHLHHMFIVQVHFDDIIFVYTNEFHVRICSCYIQKIFMMSFVRKISFLKYQTQLAKCEILFTLEKYAKDSYKILS